jgi:uncharacterized membrane protein
MTIPFRSVLFPVSKSDETSMSIDVLPLAAIYAHTCMAHALPTTGWFQFHITPVSFSRRFNHRIVVFLLSLCGVITDWVARQEVEVRLVPVLVSVLVVSINMTMKGTEMSSRRSLER